MNFYLRVVNPAVALLVLGLCYWASITDKGIEHWVFLMAAWLPTFSPKACLVHRLCSCWEKYCWRSYVTRIVRSDRSRKRAK